MSELLRPSSSRRFVDPALPRAPGFVPAGDGRTAQWRAWWTARANSADPLLRAAAVQGFVLHLNELAALGVTRQRARTAVKRGRWAAPARGVFAPLAVAAEEDDARLVARRRHALSAAAGVLIHRDHVVSGRSAAVLDGLPVLSLPPAAQLTSALATGLGARGAALVRGAQLYSEDVTSWFGVPCTTVARTLVDLARHDRRDAIMAADAALRERLVSADDLALALDIARGWPGIRQARDVLELADPAAESPLESIVRLAMHDDGFPQPVLQAQIGPYRVDLLLPEQRLIIEADGREKYTGEELWHEKLREQALRELGYVVFRILWADVVLRWPQSSARLRRLLYGRLHPPRG